MLALASVVTTPLFAQTRPPAAATPARTAAAALARAGDAVVTVVAYRDGTSATGTGVRVTDGRVITALRHLRGATRAEIFGAEGDLLATVNTLEQAEVTLDLAVFARIAVPGERIALSRRSAPLASKVNVLGVKMGTTRSVVARTVTHVEPDASGRPMLRLGAAVATSAAGSPVVNARSELVAIALGTLPGRVENDIAVDVAAVRELLARPTALLAFPTREGTVSAARPDSDPKAAGTGSSASPADAAARSRTAGIFPERYGAPIAADTARGWAVELYGCAQLESRKKVYCYLRITNLTRGATFELNGGDLTDGTRRKLRSAENLIVGETVQRVAGWRKKAEVPLRELESSRVALEFSPPQKATDPFRLMVDVAGERPLWFGPFVLQRAP
ncbi:MAG: trypsin-like peptidase domain-containing protein [Gemmatimonadota bacterium]